MSQHFVTRGMSGLQRNILDILDTNGGRASTKTLINSLDEKVFPESFYRSLNNLQKRGRAFYTILP
jgi:Fe2+ or Zn2+ uptake regulation protein